MSDIKVFVFGQIVTRKESNQVIAWFEFVIAENEKQARTVLTPSEQGEWELVYQDSLTFPFAYGTMSVKRSNRERLDILMNAKWEALDTFARHGR